MICLDSSYTNSTTIINSSFVQFYCCMYPGITNLTTLYSKYCYAISISFNTERMSMEVPKTNVSRLEENDWANIFKLIKKCKCTGAGAFIGAGVLPLGREIANKGLRNTNIH